MNESASQFGGFGFSGGRRNEGPRRDNLSARNAWSPHTYATELKLDNNATHYGYDATFERCEALNRASDAVRPLLQLQYAAADGDSTILVCANVRQVQRSFYMFTRGRRTVGAKTFVIHERMPIHQQDYVFECLDASCDFLMECPVALFTTTSYFAVLMDRLPWLEPLAEILLADGASAAPHPGRFIAPGDVPPKGIERLSVLSELQSVKTHDEPTVSCICLREGESGHWLLTDHNDAAVIRPDETPAPELLPRLLKHCTEVQGHELAPYLARNFDVPAAWKVYPELITRSLLIFRKNQCATNADIPGIPKAITWSDTLGLIY